MHAQTTLTSPEGIYYLTGVMETASGFKLNADHTFEFFFSYGALDREGHGTWKQEGADIIFNSEGKERKDYGLVQSRKQAGGLTVKITGGNEQLYRLLHVAIRDGEDQSELAADKDGYVHFPVSSAASISLLFEWCPEKTFVYSIPDTTHNYFEFRFEPSIMDVIFDNFKLQLVKDGLTGPHPMDTSKKFNYKKESSKE